MTTLTLGARIGAIVLTGAVALTAAALPASATTDSATDDTAVGSPLDTTESEAPVATGVSDALAAYGGDPTRESYNFV